MRDIVVYWCHNCRGVRNGSPVYLDVDPLRSGTVKKIRMGDNCSVCGNHLEYEDRIEEGHGTSES